MRARTRKGIGPDEVDEFAELLAGGVEKRLTKCVAGPPPRHEDVVAVARDRWRAESGGGIGGQGGGGNTSRVYGGELRPIGGGRRLPPRPEECLTPPLDGGRMFPMCHRLSHRPTP